MSEVYVHEPPLKGKVVLHTTHGDLDIELWSKECPTACRNFIQLCLEGYYDKTIFHRIIKDFLVQTGDPTGTGRGGESVYGMPFPNEIHSRLKFRYRGLVGIANLGSKESTNGSQFFITLGRADYLNNKHTLFGKVTGPSIFNLIKISEVETDQDDMPLDPPKILSTEVLWNPFDDIVPRSTKVISVKSEPAAPDRVKPLEKRGALSSQKLNLLSFDSMDEDAALSAFNRIPKSAHDLLDDPRLLKEEATSYSTDTRRKDEQQCGIKQSEYETKSAEASHEAQSHTAEETAESEEESVSSPVHAYKAANSAKTVRGSQSHKKHEESSRPRSSSLALKKGVGYLQRIAAEREVLQNADLMTEKEKKYHMYLQKSRDVNKRKREDHAYEKLLTFNARLKSFAVTGESRANRERSDVEEKEEGSVLPNLDEEIDESDGSWLCGSGLKFSVDSARAYDLDAAKDSLAVFDPLTVNDAEEAIKFRKKQRLKPSSGRVGPVARW